MHWQIRELGTWPNTDICYSCNNLKRYKDCDMQKYNLYENRLILE